MSGWQDDAICHDDPNFFRTDPKSVALAIEVCSWCPVIADCMAWARSEERMDGIAAGVEWRDGKAGPFSVRPPRAVPVPVVRPERPCEECDEVFTQVQIAQRFCSERCQRRASDRRHGSHNPPRVMPVQTDPLLLAHAAYCRGVRDELTVDGEREYQRNRRRRARECVDVRRREAAAQQGYRDARKLEAMAS